MVVATVQAVKVLGIHCAAKRVDSQASLQWLTAIGCDFAQGQALAQVLPIDSLASSPRSQRRISAMAMPSLTVTLLNQTPAGPQPRRTCRLRSVAATSRAAQSAVSGRRSGCEMA